MKRSKKLLGLVLCAIMALSLLAGCGGGSGSSGGSGDSEAGRVYWLNMKPESDGALQDVAKLYTEKTGVNVQVVTAASGTYDQTLTAELAKSAPPTMFVIGTQIGVNNWKDYALDLSGSAIVNELNTDAYNLYDEDGRLVSVGY